MLIKYFSVLLMGIGIFINIYSKYNNYENEVRNEKAVEQVITDEIEEDSPYISVIEIPVLNIKTVIYFGNKSMNTIDKGVSYMYNTNTPDSDGLVILLGHSGNSNVSYFKNIDKLQNKDLIIIHYNNKKYNYFITKSYIVDQYETEIFNKKISKGIMLITCLTEDNKKRLVVEGIREDAIY